MLQGFPETEARIKHQTIVGNPGFAATRNARIVLIDDNGVRATMTASWLIVWAVQARRTSAA